MVLHRLARQRELRWLGVMLLTLGLSHAPLPVADFHNIRHHDGPGQVCAYHDHLLRWHPDAGAAADVAVLHWHWLMPMTGSTVPLPSGDGPALHASVPDLPGVPGDSAPRLAAPSSTRLLVAVAASLAGLASPSLDALATAPTARAGPLPALAASLPSRSRLASILQRWDC